LEEPRRGIEQVADEIIGSGGLDEVILAPRVEQSITTTVVKGLSESPSVRGEVYHSIQTLQKEHGGLHLFAVNIAPATVVAEFGNLPAAATEAEVLFEGRSAPISDGRFRDVFVEAEVHIYRIGSADTER
jgi:hypothetical protein